MANKKSPRYEVDDTTRQMLETVLNITAQSAQLQIAEEMAEALFNITDNLAERFNIDTRIYQIEDEDDEEPRSITLYRSRSEGRPVNTDQPIINGKVFPFPFRVIDGDKPTTDTE